MGCTVRLAVPLDVREKPKLTAREHPLQIDASSVPAGVN